MQLGKGCLQIMICFIIIVNLIIRDKIQNLALNIVSRGYWL